MSKTIAAFGAGRMGRGIAHVFAYAGHPVKLIDSKSRSTAEYDTFSASVWQELRANLNAIATAGLFDSAAIEPILQRVQLVPYADMAQALAEAEVVFEGVPEILEHKQKAFGLISQYADDDALITSTTSTILVDTLAAMVARPERFLNAHWLNPAYLIPLVEVSPGTKTDPAMTAQLTSLLEAIGKVPVVCAASPGFIVPRIQALAMNEAARMVEEGVASAEEIDKAIRYGFGFRFAILGLVEFIDWGGGDILYYASRYLSEALQSERFNAPDVIIRNMENGQLGLRSGQGFYDFATIDVEQYRQQTLARFVALLQHIDAARAPVLDEKHS